ncbi:MAG: serine/threonine protein kinase, partial [Acidobacteriota bacterium]|nr:serine/threonine protein kinase [Acidobacteriota bacterium]
MSLAPGSRLGPYEIVSPLGAGGMGEVYRARDTRLGREVAVKVLPPGFSGDADRLLRFEREARAASALNHPNILTVHDVGTQDGAPYVVSELLEGETLRERLSSGALTSRRAVDYATQIARGLAAAHEKGIVHRDLKPENLFVTKDGRVKILDFGLAKLTRPEMGGPATKAPTQTAGTEPGVILGTVGYMSPEQVRGEAADQISDIFSLGAVLYEMLTGRRAFRGASAIETLNAILKEEPAEVSQT